LRLTYLQMIKPLRQILTHLGGNIGAVNITLNHNNFDSTLWIVGYHWSITQHATLLGSFKSCVDLIKNADIFVQTTMRLGLNKSTEKTDEFRFQDRFYITEPSWITQYEETIWMIASCQIKNITDNFVPRKGMMYSR